MEAGGGDGAAGMLLTPPEGPQGAAGYQAATVYMVPWAFTQSLEELKSEVQSMRSRFMDIR